MSTPCEVVLYSNDKYRADEMAKLILNETKRLEKKYNYFSPTSYLSELNKRSTNILDSETKSLLQRAQKYYKSTGGIFDITVATIKDIYKLSGTLEELEEKKSMLEPFVGCEHFSIKKDKLLFDNEQTKIDLGGFVKEYAVDRAVHLLKKKKFTSALVNYGGDIYALGTKPKSEPFIIGIKDPNNPSQNITEVEISNQALTTSASYERNSKIEGETFSHIISTKKFKNEVLSATVISDNCIQSGVYSTSLMINPDLKTNDKVLLF